MCRDQKTWYRFWYHYEGHPFRYFFKGHIMVPMRFSTWVTDRPKKQNFILIQNFIGIVRAVSEIRYNFVEELLVFSYIKFNFTV